MTKEEVLLDALGYKSKSAWKKGNDKAYRLALKSGWMTEASAHMVRPEVHNKKWTKNSTLEEAKKYKTKSEWFRLSQMSYVAARQLGIFEKASAHMISPYIHWSEDKIKEEAKKYKTTSEWQLKSHGLYDAARRFGLFVTASAFMDKPTVHNKKWDRTTIADSANKHKTLVDWSSKEGGAVSAARRIGILNEVTSHMKKLINESNYEITLLSTVKDRFPNAQKALFGKRVKGQYGSSFELDIYIPELKKGIEFNGDYWHSPEGLRRGRPGWPEEKLAKYHEIKKEFFGAKGVVYLEIWESEWEANKEECLARIWAFLSS